MRFANLKQLEQIQGSLQAALQDAQSEECGHREGLPIDVGGLDTAIFHASEALSKLRLLRAAVAQAPALAGARV